MRLKYPHLKRRPSTTPELRDIRAIIVLLYEGPFAKACGWLWRFHEIDPNTPEDEIVDPPVSRPRDMLANLCQDLDYTWREYYARRLKLPHDRWRITPRRP